MPTAETQRTTREIDRVSGQVVDSAIVVHSALGPGLLESTYETCLACELTARGLCVQRDVPLPIRYKGIQLDLAYRLDLLVNDCVIVELKTVSKILPVHEAQLLSYLRLRSCKVGLLINFHVPLLLDGIKRLVNDY